MWWIPLSQAAAIEPVLTRRAVLAAGGLQVVVEREGRAGWDAMFAVQ